MSVFEDAIDIAASPDAVRAWFTDIDPATIVGRNGNELEIRAKFGAMRVRETFRAQPDGSWMFWTRAPFGIVVHDRFHAEAGPRGAILRVRCEIGGANLLGRIAAAMYSPLGKRQFKARWRAMARQCERDSART